MIPEIDSPFGSAIELAFRTLIERCYLYQKVTVDFDAAEQQARSMFEAQAARQIPPVSSPGQISTPYPTPAAEAKKEREAATKRPWRAMTHHMGDDPLTIEASSVARIGMNSGLGMSSARKSENQIPVPFHLPAVQILCPSSCKATTTFVAQVSSKYSPFGSPFPFTGTTGVEQIFVPVYRCEICRSAIYTLLVRRTGARLHLCGFAPRRGPQPSRSVPDSIRPILSDAEQAIAEGDVYAAFYHLRTMIEHYLKQRLAINAGEQIRGEDLIARHHEALPVAWRSVLPSISEPYSTLSKNLHGREGEAEDFAKLRDAIGNHIEMLSTLERSRVA